MMVEHELAEVKLRDGGEWVVIRRGAAAPVVEVVPQAVAPSPAPIVAAPVAAPGGAGGIPEGLIAVKSPMVGSFYASPDPDSTPYVSVGSMVAPDTVVCVIEAMKVFNEIKADVAGTIEQILVRNEEAVEYGQPLFLVRPA